MDLMFLIPQVMQGLFALKVYGLVVFREYLNLMITRKDTLSSHHTAQIRCAVCTT